MTEQNPQPQQPPQPWWTGNVPPGAPPAQHAAPPPPPPKKRRGLKIFLGIVGAFVAIGVISSLVDGDTEPQAPTAQATGKPAVVAAPEPTPEPEVTTAEEPAVQEPAEEPAPDPKPTPKPKPIKYEGRGDKILSIEKPDASGVGYAIITHKGSSNFVVETAETSELLVNEIGRYSGRVLFDVSDGESTKRLKITASGSWTVTTLAFESLRVFQDEISGEGDDIVVYIGDEGVASIKHDGESNFVVQAHGESSDLLINEIGSYAGEQLFEGGRLLQITADGDWSIKVAAE